MSLDSLLVVIFLVAFGLAVLLWLRARSLRQSAGLPEGRVVYSDMDRWQSCEPLYSATYGLVGKPDYIVEKGQEIIPIEVKPSRRAPKPYESDIMQLAAYCLLIEEAFRVTPSRGLLRYRDETFEIPYGTALREHLLDLLDEMRQACDAYDVEPSHNEPQRCRYCGQAEHCAMRLVD